jgi:hypothetical protein
MCVCVCVCVCVCARARARYVHVCCHEAGERGERRLGYRYIFLFFLNIKICVVRWLALNFWSYKWVWVRVLVLHYFCGR